jgi:hypothetical protein
MMPVDDAKLRRLVQSVQLPRPQFREIYDALATEKGGDQFKLLQLMADPADPPYLDAFRQAHDGGWLSLLTERLLAVNAFPETNEDSATGKQLRVALQGLVQPTLGFLNADMLRSGVIIAVRRVCRISVSAEDSASFGTGFLVGPQAVITSWHVIAPLLDASGTPKENSAEKIRVEFDAIGTSHTLTTVGVVAQWLVGSSKVHPIEHPPAQLDFGAAAPDGFDKHLDYALIRLDKPVGRERGYYRLDRSRKPAVDGARTQITLFQHPYGTNMWAAMGTGLALWPPRIETRFRHNANSMNGSSGGLILDADFEPVALHQCGILRDDGQAVVNGAIPTACIAANDDPFEGTTGLDPLWHIAETDAPVIGREDFQRHVLNAIAGNTRIIAVRGEPKTGKTFSIAILRALLGLVEHSVIEMKAANISPVPARLAADLLESMGAPVLETEPLPATADALTAQDAWIRDTLYPEFARRAYKAAGKRILWLAIDDLDTNPLANSASRHLLERLYSDIASLPFLRIVLLGLTGPVPAALPKFVGYDATQPFTRAEIETYLQRRFVERRVNGSETEMRRMAAAIVNTIGFYGNHQVGHVAQLIGTAIDPTIAAMIP